MDDVARFIGALFNNKNPAHYILIWTLKDRISAWFDDCGQAIAYAQAHRAEDIFAGVGLAPCAYPPNRRVAERDVAALVGLYADVDYASGGAHTKPNLPSQPQALGLIDAMPIQPTLIVHTGHGYHAWWLFKEPLELSDEGSWLVAKDVCQRWQTLLRGKAQARGWTIDSTFDLARVMRIAGTANCKSAETVYASIAAESDTRLGSLEDLAKFLPEIDTPPTLAQNISYNFVVDYNANPPGDKLSALLENDIQFEKSWHRRRRDLRDQSPSGYDMSMASLAAKAGWSDQEIVDMLVAARRINHDERRHEPSYYARTLAKARANAARDIALDEIDTIHAEDANAKDKVSDVLGLRVDRIVRYPTPMGGIYYMEIGDQRVPLGDENGLIEQGKFRSKIADLTGRLPKNMKPDKWYVFAQLLLDMCERDEGDSFSDERGQMIGWLRDYLTSWPPSADKTIAVTVKTPVYTDGRVAINMQHFANWLFMAYGERSRRGALLAAIKLCGAESTTIAARLSSGRMSSVSMWMLPAAEWAEFAPQEKDKREAWN